METSHPFPSTRHQVQKLNELSPKQVTKDAAFPRSPRNQSPRLAAIPAEEKKDVERVVHFNIATPADTGARSRSVTPGTHRRILQLEIEFTEMRQARVQEIARRDAEHREDMIKMKDQLQHALAYLENKQEPSASATQDTVSMATSSSSDVAASGFVVIVRRPQEQQLPKV